MTDLNRTKVGGYGPVPGSNVKRPPRPSTPTRSYQVPVKNGEHPVFSTKMVKMLSGGAATISRIGAVVLILGMVLFGVILDVAAGGFSLSNSIKFGVPMGSWELAVWVIPWGLSVFTSGVQILMRMYWKVRQGELRTGQNLILWGIMLLDTAFDFALPAWLVYGQNPLEFDWSGKPLYFYLLTILVGVACAFAETATMAVAELGERR